jgi:hypothetical protein
MAVMIGLVNWIAVASASGIAITPMKKQMVARLTAAPRPIWSQGRGNTKPARPCRTATNSARPIPPKLYLRAATAVPGQSPAMLFTIASPNARLRNPQRARISAGVAWRRSIGPHPARLGNCQSFPSIHHSSQAVWGERR